MLTANDIKELAHSGEGFNVDFKRSVPSKVRDIVEEVCSFANSAGGYVLIGIDNDNQIIGAEIGMHLVEHVGSGIPRMKKDMLDAGLPEPIFETEGMFTVIFRRPTATQTPIIKKEFQLTQIQNAILSAIAETPTITMVELGVKLGVGRSSVYNNIKELKEQKILSREGRKNDGKWIILTDSIKELKKI